MHWFVLLAIALTSVNAQGLTSIDAKHRKQFQSDSPYYSPGYYPNTKFKPDSKFKAIPPQHNPSDICFNPNYYGFLNTGDGISQTCPVPQSNIYYMPNGNIPPSSAQPIPAWPPYQYTPWIWNDYPYLDNPASQLTSAQTNKLSLTSSHSPNAISDNQEPSSTVQQNETVTSPKEIIINRPTISVKIVPPAFNNNATLITNLSPSLSNLDIEHQNTKVSDKNRRMIKKLLEMGSRFLKSKDDRSNNKNTNFLTDEDIGVNPAMPDNGMVILPNRQLSENKYPLPKDVFGDKNEPSSSFERIKIFTEFNPPI